MTLLVNRGDQKMGLTLATIPLAVTNLSRMQFAVTAITHFLFVTTTIGMLLTTMIFEFVRTRMAVAILKSMAG